MTITVYAHGFDLTAALQEYAQRRVGAALGRFAGKVTRVVVRLTDVNGPRGGVDKRCLVHVSLSDRPAVVIKDSQDDLYVAIDRAAARAARSLVRRATALRYFRRRGSNT
jgi:ribosomal subunit interface protein